MEHNVKIIKLQLANDWYTDKTYAVSIDKKIHSKYSMYIGLGYNEYNNMARSLGGELYDGAWLFDAVSVKKMYDWINSKLVMQQMLS